MATNNLTQNLSKSNTPQIPPAGFNSLQDWFASITKADPITRAAATELIAQDPTVTFAFLMHLNRLGLSLDTISSLFSDHETEPPAGLIIEGSARTLDGAI